jgi:hypothetical protein
MPEFTKKVWGIQFTLSDEDRSEIVKGAMKTFEGHHIKHGGNGRCHVLIPIGDRLIPIYETQWLVHDNGTQIIHDAAFRATYSQINNLDPAALQQKLEQVIQDRKK